MLHEEILKEANNYFLYFLKEQQRVNEDKNITSDEDEPVAVVITSQRLQASNILDGFYAKVPFWEKSSFQQKYKLLLVTTMKIYNTHLITLKKF